MRRSIRIASLLLAASLGWAGMAGAAHDAGTEPALYLGSGAKAMAMGRTGVTDFETALTADWNPAGLGILPRCDIALQHASLFGGAMHETLAAGYPTLDWGGVGLHLSRLQAGGVEQRDEYNIPQGDFGLVEQQGSLAYGYPLLDFLSLGAAVKLHDLRLNDLESMAPGADAGLLLHLPHPLGNSPTTGSAMLQSVTAGLACRNAWGPRLRLDRDYEQFYATWRAGLAVSLGFVPELNDRLVFRAEAEKPEFADTRWHAGMEYSVYEMVALRGGWDHEYFSAGAGFQYAGIRLDYAASFPVLGMRHLVTLSAALGEDMQKVRARREAEAERRRQEIVNNLKQKIIDDYRQQAQRLTRARQDPEALKLWEKVLDWDPEHAEALREVTSIRSRMREAEVQQSLQLARQYLHEQRYIDVMVECRSVLDQTPEHAEAKELYTQAEKKAMRLGQTSMIANVQMIERMRQDYQQGLQAYTERDWEAAVRHWEKVIENTPLQKQVYHYLQQARERMAQARQHPAAGAGKTQQEEKQRTLYKRAVDLSRSGNLKEAVQTWENLVKENPEDQDAKQNLDKTRQDFINSQKKGIRW